MTERDPLVLIQEALTDGEVCQFLDEAARRWPGTEGAHVADVLELTISHDEFLDQTEPFFEEHGDHLPAAAPNTAALHALIILGRELTMANLIAVLLKAGLMPVPAVPALRWRVASAPSGAQPARAAIGWQAQGREFFYLTGAKTAGPGYFLTRWPIDGATHLDDLTEACRNVADVDSDIAGRRLAELFEAGESIPEIGWFPGARPGAEYRLAVDSEPGGDTALADLPAIWRRAAARMGSAVSSTLEGCAMALERALAAEPEGQRWPGEDPRS
jgi:hypothetical protein